MNGTFVLVQAMVLISRWCLRTTSGLSTLANVAKHPVYFQPRADLVGDPHNQAAGMGDEMRVMKNMATEHTESTDLRSRLQY